MWPFKRKPRHKSIPTGNGTVYLCESVLKQSIETLSSSGNAVEHHEGIVYWAGRRYGLDSLVTTCIAPAATATYGSFKTSSYTNAKVVMWLAREELELLGQVHSHPGSFVDHSQGDDELALMPFEGFLSIVIPHYGQQGIWPLTQCGVHRFEAGQFRRLSTKELEKSFRVIPDFCDIRALP